MLSIITLTREARRCWNSKLSSVADLFLLRAGCTTKAQKMVGLDNNITKVLFCGPEFPASHTYTREYLQKFSFIQVDDVPLDDVPDVIGQYHICVVKMRRLDSEVIARANKMKLIMQFGVGLEGVDVDAATYHGIKVARIPSDMTGNASSLCRDGNISHVRPSTQADLYLRVRKYRIELAKRLRPFGVRILATKRSWDDEAGKETLSNGLSGENGGINDLIDEKGLHKDLYDFAREADIVVVCLCMNRETSGIVNEKFLSSMRKGSLLVNIARGGLLDYKAVVDSLKLGHLGGLGIDVAWTEPFDPEDPILKLPNVLITPHVAGVTEYSYRTMAQVVGDCALQLHAGAPLTGIEFVN